MSIQFVDVYIIVLDDDHYSYFFLFFVGKEAPSKELSMSIQLVGGYYYYCFSISIVDG